MNAVTAGQRIPDAILEQAADWTVRSSAGDAAEQARTRAAFAAWMAEHPLHAAAAAELRGVVGEVAGLRLPAGGGGAPARAAFDAGFNDRSRAGRRALAALALAGALALPSWLALEARPAATLFADLGTATGEWRERTLDDGSRITLGSGSAVDLHFDAGRRTLTLRRGAVLVDVAPDAARPFTVETRHGAIRALGTRFSVEYRGGETGLAMLEHGVEVRPASGSAATMVMAGERVRITADGVVGAGPVTAREIDDVWRFRHLAVRNRPLAEVLEELDRHRPGRILFDRDRLAGINMAVVLPLDDTDRALQLLAESLPALRVRTLTPWLVKVELQPAP